MVHVSGPKLRIAKCSTRLTAGAMRQVFRVYALMSKMAEDSALADCIAKGATPFHQALPLSRQIAGGLDFAHKRGIVHRDLKPAMR